MDGIRVAGSESNIPKPDDMSEQFESHVDVLRASLQHGQILVEREGLKVVQSKDSLSDDDSLSLVLNSIVELGRVFERSVRVRFSFVQSLSEELVDDNSVGVVGSSDVRVDDGVDALKETDGLLHKLKSRSRVSSADQQLSGIKSLSSTSTLEKYGRKESGRKGKRKKRKTPKRELQSGK